MAWFEPILWHALRVNPQLFTFLVWVLFPTKATSKELRQITTTRIFPTFARPHLPKSRQWQVKLPLYVLDTYWVNPFAYLTLPIGSHFASWNLGISPFCSVLPVGYSIAFNIWEFSPFIVLFPPLCFLFEIPSLTCFICWFLFCSWDLGSLLYWVFHFSTMLCFSLLYPLAFIFFFILPCSLFSLKCPTKVLGFSNFF